MKYDSVFPDSFGQLQAGLGIDTPLIALLLKMPGVAMMSWVCGWCDWCSHACPEVYAIQCMHGWVDHVRADRTQPIVRCSQFLRLHAVGWPTSTDTTKLHEDAVAI